MPVTSRLILDLWLTMGSATISKCSTARDLAVASEFADAGQLVVRVDDGMGQVHAHLIDGGISAAIEINGPFRIGECEDVFPPAVHRFGQLTTGAGQFFTRQWKAAEAFGADPCPLVRLRGAWKRFRDVGRPEEPGGKNPG